MQIIKYFPYVLFSTGFLILVFSIYIWHSSKSRKAKIASFPFFIASIWTIAHGIEYISGALFWYKVENICLLAMPPALFIFAIIYVSPNDKSKLKYFAPILLIEPLVYISLIGTSSQNYQLWKNISSPLFSIDNISFSINLVRSINSFYSLALLSASFLVLFVFYFQTPRNFRHQNVLTLVSLSIYSLGYINTEIAWISPSPPPFGITFAAFLLSALTISVNKKKFGFLSLMPVTRKNIIDKINNPLIAYDDGNKVTWFNKEAEDLLDGQEEIVFGSQIERLSIGGSRLINYFPQTKGIDKNLEIVLGEGKENRYLDPSFSSPAKDSKDGKISLINFNEVTEIREELQSKLDKITLETLEALAQTVAAKDKYTEKHLKRVQDIAFQIGKSMNLSQNRLHQLLYASELHDIGKLHISDRILNKPGELYEHEWKKIRQHPKIGKEIVGKIGRFQDASRIIFEHHERFDGSGYPRGISGTRISLEARILSAVDAWDAMRSDRPYRGALPKNDAILELKENSGSQFDPQVVGHFMKLIHKYN